MNPFLSIIARRSGVVVGGSVPTFVAGGSTASTTSTTLTPGLPTGWAANDIFIMSVAQHGNQSSTGYPTISGWTSMGTYTDSQTSATWYWRRSTASESAPLIDLVTNDSSNAVLGKILAFRGCATGVTPYSDLSLTNYYSSSITIGAVTPTVDNGLYVGIMACGTRHSWSVAPPASGTTLLTDVNTSSGNDARITAISSDTDTIDNATPVGPLTVGTLDQGWTRTSMAFVLNPI